MIEACRTHRHPHLPHTASAAEDFLVYLDNQPTSLRLGPQDLRQHGPAFIPGAACGGSARICTPKDVFPRRAEFGAGHRPQIEVNPTVGDFIPGPGPSAGEGGGGEIIV